MADKKESNEDILRAILEKGGARFKEQVAKELAKQETAPAPAAAKTRKKSLKGVVGSISNTKYYYGPGGTIVDKDGVPASERISAMLKQKDEMADQVKSAIMPKSLRPVEGEINKAIKQTSKLSKTQDAIYAKTPAIFGEFDKTIQNLTQQHENIVRQLIQQNQDLQDKVIEALTGQKAATRAGGAVAPKRMPKASASRAVGGSRAATAAPVKAAYQKARITKPAAVKARQESMLKAREEKTQRMVRKGMIVGAGVGAAASILNNMGGGGGGAGGGGGGGGGASPGATPSTVPGMVKLVTPGGREYTVAEQYASNFKGFVDELENSGYKINSIGGYANRNIAGTGTKSYHSLGVAIDINPGANPHLFDGRLQTDMPSNVGAMAAKYGLGWGGNWRSSKDAMHFSMAAGEGGSVSIDRSGISPLPGAPAPQTGSSNIPAVGTPSGGAVNPGNISAPGAGPPTGFAPATGGNASWQTDKPFMDEVNRVAQKFNIKADDLLAVMASESGVKANAVNPKGGATGLIQFMPRTATALGTTTAALQQMSRAEQMTYVDKFLTMNNLPSGASAGRIYATIFLPGRASKDVLTERGEIYYESNRALDMNGDGKITISDLDARIAQKAAAFGIGSTTTAQQGAPQVAAAPAQNPGNIAAPGVTPPSGTAPGEPQRATGGDFPGGDIVAAGKWLEGQGIRVSENPSFGGVGGMHKGRGHADGRAIDVNAGYGIEEASDPVWGPRFDELAAKAKAAGYTVIWRSAGHYNHMHIEVPAGGPQGGTQTQTAAQGTTPQAAPPPPTAPSMTPQRPANPGIAFNQASRGMNIEEQMMEQMQNIMPIIFNNTQYVNNTRTITRGQSNVSRPSNGFDPLATVAAAAGFAIGKGLRGLF